MKQNKILSGPLSYENWKRYESGVEWDVVFEYPLFSDAHIVGEPDKPLGPYEIINNVASFTEGRPALILRIIGYAFLPLPDMSKTQKYAYHGGIESDEIAALISLYIGIRLKAGGCSRTFGKGGDPRGRPVAYPDPIDPVIRKQPHQRGYILPNVTGTHSITEFELLMTLPLLSALHAVALVRAARMYQEAVWIAETSPEMAWLLLISAVETVADVWRADNVSAVEKVLKWQPQLQQIIEKYGGDKSGELLEEVAQLLGPIVGSTRSFREFILNFLPPPPPLRPYEWAQQSWDTSELNRTINQIYNYRSRALHGGHPFPAPMCMPPDRAGEHGEFEEKPAGLAMSTKGAVWASDDMPLHLNTFEYIARNAIINWWKSQVPSPSEL